VFCFLKHWNSFVPEFSHTLYILPLKSDTGMGCYFKYHQVCIQATDIMVYKINEKKGSMLIKIQPDATVCRYLFTAKVLLMMGAVTPETCRVTLQ